MMTPPMTIRQVLDDLLDNRGWDGPSVDDITTTLGIDGDMTVVEFQQMVREWTDD